MTHTFCAEEYPCKTGQGERDDHQQQFPQGGEKFSLGHGIQVGAVGFRQYRRHHVKAVQETPDDKSPVGAMPEAAYITGEAMDVAAGANVRWNS